jgi:hypothetical protein
MIGEKVCMKQESKLDHLGADRSYLKQKRREERENQCFHQFWAYRDHAGAQLVNTAFFPGIGNA